LIILCHHNGISSHVDEQRQHNPSYWS